jgi:hypothetical protein
VSFLIAFTPSAESSVNESGMTDTFGTQFLGKYYMTEATTVGSNAAECVTHVEFH